LRLILIVLAAAALSLTVTLVVAFARSPSHCFFGVDPVDHDARVVWRIGAG